jgi:hypothetical protein
MQYPAIWHSIFDQISLTKFCPGEAINCSMPADFGKLIAQKRRQTAKTFLAAKPALFWTLN